MTIDERLAAIEQRHKEDQQFRENLIEEITNDYGFGRAIAEACVNKGYEDGHYASYNEVRTQSQIATDFAEKILAIIVPK